MTGDDGHHLYERRRLRRRIGFWRLVAIAAVAISATALFWNTTPRGNFIARHEISGAIFDDPRRDAFLRELAQDNRARALILRINSPGGSVTGSEALFEALRTVAERKPVVAVLGEVAASGGYIAALAADFVVARGSTITGSIGVIAEFPNIEGLLDTIGIDFARVASGPLKAEPSPLRRPSEEVLEAQEAVVADAFDWFIDLVARRRDLEPEQALAVGDGRIFSGRQALAAGLIDALGGEPEARAWLTETHGLSETLPVRTVAPRRRTGLTGLIDTLSLDALVGRLIGPPRLMAIMR